MKEINYQTTNVPIRVCITFGFAQIGSYRLRLWDAVSNKILLDKSGNNQNPEDDCYELPGSPDENNGRYVQCEYSIISPDPKPGDQYSVEVSFQQGGQSLGSLKDTGLMKGKRVSSEFWVVLKKS